MGFLTVLGLIPKLFSAAGTAYRQYQETKKAEHDANRAIIIARERSALELAKTQFQHGEKQIAATSKWFKHLTFFLWFGPFIITTVCPEYGAQIFENWKMMPEWYAKTCTALMFFIWGVQVSKTYIDQIFAGASAFFSKRREQKINRELFMETTRTVKHERNLPLEQREVDLIDKVFDRIQNR